MIIRFVKFEILDIEAILEAIEKKNTMLYQEQAKIQQKAEDEKLLNIIMTGENTFSTFFMSKKDKV